MKPLLAMLLKRLESKGYEVKPRAPHLPHSPQANAIRQARQQMTGSPGRRRK